MSESDSNPFPRRSRPLTWVQPPGEECTTCHGRNTTPEAATEQSVTWRCLDCGALILDE